MREAERIEDELVQAIADDDFATVERLSSSLQPSAVGLAISIAAFWGHHRLVELLLKKKCDVCIRDANGYTPLHEAAKSMNVNPETVKLLIESGADVNAEAEGGWRITPLHLVLNRIPLNGDDRQIVDRLLENGAKVNSIVEAVAMGDESLALQMIDADLPVDDLLHHSERTALHVAAILGNPSVIAGLIRRGVWLDAADHDHKTALELAASEDVRQMLLTAGARTNDEVWAEINSAMTVSNFVKGIQGSKP
jgi:ankyrin repeat protein